MLDGYGLHSLIWNLADQVVSGILIASPMDERGRGIALEVRDAGAACDLTGATAYLVWTHRGTGKPSSSLAPGAGPKLSMGMSAQSSAVSETGARGARCCTAPSTRLPRLWALK